MENELKEIKELALNNAKGIQENARNIEENFKNINNNSYALEILKDYKNGEERLYKILKSLIKVLVLIIVLWVFTIGYLVYVLNDTGTIEETTQEITDFETINGDITNKG